MSDVVMQRVRMRLSVRRAWLTHLAEQGHRDLDIAIGDLDRLDDELEWRTEYVPDELSTAIDTADAVCAQGGWLGSALAQVFGLSRAEVDLVHVLYAADRDPRIRRALVAGTGNVLDETTALRLCDHVDAVLGAESPLARWRIVEIESVAPGEPRALAIDPAIRRWLDGFDDLDAALIDVARRGAPMRPLSSWPVGWVTDVCKRAIVESDATPRRVIVRGRPGSGRRNFAIAVAEALGLNSLVVSQPATGDRAADRDVGLRARRHAYLSRTVLVWVGAPPPGGTPFPVEFVIGEPHESFDDATGVHRADRSVDEPVDEPVDLLVDLPGPDADDRHRLWAELVPASAHWLEPVRSDLIDRQHVSVGDIADVGRVGLTEPADVAEHLNRRQRSRVGHLLEPLPLPYRRDDLVLAPRADEAIDFLVFEVRERRRSLADGHRLLPQRGVIALLTGPPGVGKTMSAQVIAGELGVDLLRVNLAETISKYVGETAKHIHTVLSEAALLDAVVFVDECDTLFGRRTELRDAHDRYANADTNFLLQAIESFPGVALLATNRREHIDEAFTRRLRHVIDLPMPDPVERERLWVDIFTELIGDPSLDCRAVMGRVAQRYELTGADIKNAVLNSRIIAAQRNVAVDESVLLDGLDRELAKQQRQLSELERKRFRHA